MEVILQQDFPALGYVGDRVRVKPGYGRNFLIPRGVAVEASALNERVLKHRLTAINAKRVKLRGQAQELADRLQQLVLEFTLKVGGAGRSFGAVSVRDIEAQLKEKGFELDRRQIKLVEPLKKAGEYKVQVKLHAEVLAQVPVIVRAESVKAAEDKSAEGGEKKKRSSRRAKSEGETSVSGDAAANGSEPAANTEKITEH